MKGFFHKLLRIDLTARTSKEEALPDSIFERYLGGKGLGTHLLMRENPPGVGRHAHRRATPGSARRI